jgi:peptidoglycan-associated lipoprotein
LEETLTGQMTAASEERNIAAPAAAPETAVARMPREQREAREIVPSAPATEQQAARQPAAAAAAPPQALLTTPPLAAMPVAPAAVPSVKEEPIKEAARRPETITLSSVYFEFDKYNLTEQARALLQTHATLLMKIPNFTMVIEGHCDERGTHEYNLALGERRAVEVMKYLVALGVNEKKLRTMSYGEEMPAAPGSNEEAWAKNRRAEFKLTIK